MIPQDVRAAYGKANEVGTWAASLTHAQVKAAWLEWLDGIEARIEQLRQTAEAAPITLTHREVIALVGSWYRKTAETYEDNPGDPAGWEAMLDELEPADPEAAYEAHQRGLEYTGGIRRLPRLERDLDALLDAQRLKVDGRTREALLDQMHGMFAALCSRMIRRAEGDYGVDHVQATLPAWEGPTPVPVAQAAPAAAVKLTDLFEGYAKDGDPLPAPATVKAWRRHINHLKTFLGHDDAQRLTTEDVERWRDHLMSSPMKDGGKRSARTVNDTYLAGLRAVLNWAVKDAKKLPANVAAGVRVKTRARAKTRQEWFSRDEALTILRATLQTPSGRISAEHTRARRWVPWVCAYTGARVNEITQLRREDVFKQDGVWVVRITPEAGTVKDREARLVPIHSHLIDQGFVSTVQKLPPGPVFYDPKRARGGSDENPQYKKVGERLASWVRELGVSDPALQPNHAWRHTLKTRARTARLDHEARELLLGRAPRTVGEDYGGWELAALSHEVEKLPRWDLSEGQAG